MGSNLGICANIFRVIFCIINLLILVSGWGCLGGRAAVHSAVFSFLLQILGLSAIGVSIYLFVANPHSLQFVTGNSIISGAALILIAGFVASVIAIAGFVGAAFKWRPLLIIVSSFIHS